MYPSAAAIPQVNGIQTISKYKYLHRRRTRHNATGTTWEPRCSHNICPFICCFKYVTDVASLIATSAESRNMFLSEVTRTCLEAVKKDKADANRAIASQLVQLPTNTNLTGTKVYSTSSYGNPTTKPVTHIFNTSGTTTKKRIEDVKPTQAVTLIALVGVAEDLSKTQYLLCGEIKEELKALKQSIAEIPFQELSKQVQDLSKNLEIRMCSLELTRH